MITGKKNVMKFFIDTKDFQFEIQDMNYNVVASMNIRIMPNNDVIELLDKCLGLLMPGIKHRLHIGNVKIVFATNHEDFTHQIPDTIMDFPSFFVNEFYRAESDENLDIETRKHFKNLKEILVQKRFDQIKAKYLELNPNLK